MDMNLIQIQISWSHLLCLLFHSDAELMRKLIFCSYFFLISAVFPSITSRQNIVSDYLFHKTKIYFSHFSRYPGIICVHCSPPHLSHICFRLNWHPAAIPLARNFSTGFCVSFLSVCFTYYFHFGMSFDSIVCCFRRCRRCYVIALCALSLFVRERTL